MRVNIYDEEITERVEIVSKAGRIGVCFYLYLPVTHGEDGNHLEEQVRGPFQHRPDDDDSAAVTFWSTDKEKLRGVLRKALETLDQ